MSFRTDKIRGAHPITPKKGIKEVDLNIKEKGNNDRITVSVKPQTKGMKGNRESDIKSKDIPKLEEIGDTSDEALWKIKDLTAKPSIGNKEIPSDIYVKITNMLEATGDKQFEKEPYFAELVLLPKLNKFSKEALEKVASSAGLTVKDLVSSNYAPMDIMMYGYSIRLAQKSGSDKNKLRDELAKDASVHASMIGFDLDRPWNRMGETGWDSLSEMTGIKD